MHTDIIDALKRLVTSDFPYLHQTERKNAYAHIKSALIGASQTVIIERRKVMLCTYQCIYFAEVFSNPLFSLLLLEKPNLFDRIDLHKLMSVLERHQYLPKNLLNLIASSYAFSNNYDRHWEQELLRRQDLTSDVIEIIWRQAKKYSDIKDSRYILFLYRRISKNVKTPTTILEDMVSVTSLLNHYLTKVDIGDWKEYENAFMCVSGIALNPNTPREIIEGLKLHPHVRKRIELGLEPFESKDDELWFNYDDIPF